MDKQLASGVFRNQVAHFELSAAHQENLQRLQRVKDQHYEKLKQMESETRYLRSKSIFEQHKEVEESKQQENDRTGNKTNRFPRMIIDHP
jgi:DNA-binding PadR family transcriptional regulator